MNANKLASQTGGHPMVGAHRRVFFLLFFLSAVIHIHAQQPFEMASLRPGSGLLWQLTPPSADHPDGPVLYQILFRSSAHIGSIPKIGPTYTLVDSLISDDGSSIHIGGMSVNGSTGIISFAGGQTFSGVTTVNGISGAVALGAGDRISIVASGQTLIIGDSIPARWGTFSGSNNASGQYSTVAGGYTDTASGGDSTVAGGESNTASGGWSTVAGGYTDTASGGNSTVAGGGRNTASGQLSTVAGGWANTASGSYSFIAGGQNNTTGNIASPGTAGQGAFAAGQYASADWDGCFVWGDNSTTTPTTCGATNRFVVRAAGGAQFSNGVNVDTSGANGGGFTNNNFKNLLAFGALSGEAIGSQRTSTPGTNQFGLDFYTNFINRMFIDQGGTVHVVGNLTKGGGSFQIDHPLDPANKYLSHSF